MKVKGKILSLLCLLGISFSACAVVVVCPDEKFLNENPPRQNNAEEIISALNAVRTIYSFYATTPSLFGPWKNVEIVSGVIFCRYEYPPNPKLDITLRTVGGGWKQGKNSPPWDNNECRANRMLCYLTNN